MKKITKLVLSALILALSIGVNAQSTIDFETVGNSWTWTVFEYNPAWSVVANPSIGGINTSANVGKMVVAAGDQPWAGVQCAHGDFGPFTLTASAKTIKIMVYKDVISPVGIKLVTNTDWAQPEIKVSNTVVNQWEELTFDFSAYVDFPGQPGPYDRIVIFPDFPATRTAGSTTYFDNISFPGAAAATMTVSTGALSVGYQAASTNTFNIVTALAWTASSNQSWLVPSATSGTGNATITVTAAENTSSASRTATVTVTASDNTVKTVTVTQAAAPVAAAPTPIMDAANVKALYSDAYTPVASTYQNWYGTDMADMATATSGNMVKNVTSVCCFGFVLTDKDMSSLTKLHVDVYPTTLTTMSFGIVSNGDKKATITLTPNQWNAVDLTLADFAGADLTNVGQVGFWDLNGAFYMDNLLFYSGNYNVATGISNLKIDNIKCFPSSVSNSLTVSADTKISRVNIVSLVGQHIRSEIVNEKSKTIDLSDLNSGNYLVAIELTNGQYSTKKIVKL